MVVVEFDKNKKKKKVGTTVGGRRSEGWARVKLGW
jgi:hypothetical protein